jgi:RNA polymerase sigma-70 factor (ECF subfamily)
VNEEDPLRALAAAAAEGDDGAVAELVRRTQPAVWQLCTALGSPGEIDDLVQETYLRAIGALAGYRAQAPVRVWLLSIARRTCADHVRRRQRQRRLLHRVATQTVVEHSPAPAAVDDLLAALDPDRREAFVLTQLAGLSYEEAAGVVGCPVGTIRSRVARARGDLLAAVRPASTGT